MSKKIIRLALTALLLALSFPAEAQQPAKVFRIGYLSSTSSESQKSRRAAFQQGLRDLGYVEGKNIIIEYRYAEQKYERLPELVGELVRLNVDVLVAAGAPAAHAAKSATKTIPIVMQSGDPVGTGLVASLGRPGGNITGLSDFTVGVVTKRLELLKEVVPSVSRVAVLWNPTNPTNPVTLKETQTVAPTLGVTLLPLEVKEADDIDRAFTVIKKERPGALIVFGGVLTTQTRRIVELAVKSKLPAIHSVSEAVDAGGLMSYGTNFDDLFRRVATYVDKILKGAKPADLPVEQPTKFELVINLKTAKQIGLTIPPNVLARADKVIK
ncbi:MAG TPA: ABC transporter substrate-binding protein [Candidatus Binatia bacterium]|jgi:putative ABC transport system substrate-binding protein|nr:ABC transporter substrate-binding protein [Candidatus Binatia bacterium]